MTKLAIAIHELDGEVNPIVSVVKDASTQQENSVTCAVFGAVMWEICDGQQIGQYIVRLERVPSDIKVRTALFEQVEACCDCEDLDEMVHDFLSLDASSINNGGLLAQFNHIYDGGGIEELTRLVQDKTHNRCGKCDNCVQLERVRQRVMACCNPPFSHADQDIVDVWNTELQRLTCTGEADDDASG